MLGEAARDPNVTYNVQKFTYTFDGVELCGRGAIRYIGWGQISKAWGQISAAFHEFSFRYTYLPYSSMNIVGLDALGDFCG